MDLTNKYKFLRNRVAKQATSYSGKKGNYHSIEYPGVVIFVKHGPGYIDLIKKTTKKHGAEVFIELGTLCGGLTLAVKEGVPDVKVYSFDKKRMIPSDVRLIFSDKEIITFCTDLLGDKPNEILVNLLEENSDKRKILYCDNGDKAVEFNLYHKYLSSGDLIGTHDWLYEIGPDEIETALQNFEPYDHEAYIEIGAWTRFWIKK